MLFSTLLIVISFRPESYALFHSVASGVNFPPSVSRIFLDNVA